MDHIKRIALKNSIKRIARYAFCPSSIPPKKIRLVGKRCGVGR